MALPLDDGVAPGVKQHRPSLHPSPLSSETQPKSLYTKLCILVPIKTYDKLTQQIFIRRVPAPLVYLVTAEQTSPPT